MPKFALWAAALIGVAAITGSCQRKKKAKKQEARTVELSRPNLPVMILGEKLIDAGKKPRARLRYRFGSASELPLQVGAVVRIEETIDGKKKPPKVLPAVTTSFHLSTTKAAPNHVEVSVAPARIAQNADPEAKKVAEHLLSRYRKLVAGKDHQLSTTDRGLLGQQPIVPETRDASSRVLIGALIDMVIPLPEQPIGVGARWELVRTVPRATTNVKQTIQYELIALHGDRLTVRVSGKRVGERQALDAAGLPLGTTAELFALRATIDGSLIVDLKQPAAVGGSFVRTDALHTRASRGTEIISDYFSESESTITLSAKR